MRRLGVFLVLAALTSGCAGAAPPTPIIVYVTPAPTPIIVYVTPVPPEDATPSPTTGDAVRRDSPALAGVWRDTESGTRFTVELKDGVAHVTSIIDGDGEVFEIRQQGWKDGRLTWTYYVPSTGYQNTFVVTFIGPQMLDSHWSGTSGEGTQALERVE